MSDAREIGVGASATVYRASQAGLGRDVAVKLLRNDDPDFIRRFEREAKVLGRLSQNPGIVTIYDTGVTGVGQPYMLLELCESSLRDRLTAGGPVPEAEACDIMAQVAVAVTAAHEISVIHRDLKPGNVLTTADGRHLVADFGISVIDDGRQAGNATQAVGFTAPYAAPEVVNGEGSGPPADVYALGATLYHLLAGEPPFSVRDEEGLAPVVMRIVQEDPPPLDPERVSPEVASAVGAALAKDPNSRPTASEFAAALRALADQMSSSGRSDRLVPLGATTSVLPAAVAGQTTAPPTSFPAGPADAPSGPPPLPAADHASPAVEPDGGVRLPQAAAGFAYYPADEQGPRFGDRFDRWAWERIVIAVALVVALSLVGGLAYLNLRGGQDDDDQLAGPGSGERSSDEDSFDDGFTGGPDFETGSGAVDGDGGTIDPTPVDETVRVDVPMVIGDSLEEATETIEAAGLRALVVEQESDQTPGTVLEQSPSLGQATEGSLVTLTVATAKPVPTVRIPNVVGKTIAAAQSDLEGLDLRIGRQTERWDNSPAGTVLATEPGVGTTVNKTTRIGLIISRGRPSVPELVGSSVAQAEAALAEVSLKVGDQTEDVNFLVPAGEVLSTNPIADTTVDVDTPIGLVVSSGPSCEVVDVVGRTESDARLLLLDCPVAAETVTEPSATATPGTVLRVVPTASTLQLVIAAAESCDLNPNDFNRQPISVLEAAVTAKPSCELTVQRQENRTLAPGLIIKVAVVGKQVTATVTVKPTCVVPDVAGTVAMAASVQIVAAGCEGAVSGVAGLARVGGTNPAAGATIDFDTPIELLPVVAPRGCVVPLVFALPQAEAITAIRQANCTPVVVPVPVAAGDSSIGFVRSQSPVAGSTLPDGANVSIEIGVAL